VHEASSREVEKIENIKQKYVDGGAGGVAKLASAKMTEHKRSRDLSLDDCFVKITHEAYEKLRTLHANYARDGDGRDSGEGVDDDTFHDRIFALLLRYKTIHGHGFQAACSPDLFRVLHEMLQVTMECFASPMNTYFARHCSAFGDVDSAFGSVGSFATFKPTRGAYEVNPPFVAAVLDEASTWCEGLLERAELAKQPLTFIYVMPGWKETRAYSTLTASAFLRASVLIAAVDHGYCDGASHQRRDPYRQSPYDTCIFVLRTSKAVASDAVAFDPVAFDAAVRVAMRVAVPTIAQAKRQNRTLAHPIASASASSSPPSSSSS
jgi:phosphorylated CTD-interacting factor 1